MGATAISLFCGAGGCSLGFKQAGYSVLYANDNNAAAMRTYTKNFPETRTELADIENIDICKVLEEVGLEPGSLDILIGGPPCQGFSTAGSRFWDDPRNNLLKSYVEALRIIKPKWFLMENVEGLLTTKAGEYVYEVAKAFVELGYRIVIEKVYSQEFGIPQRRKRVLIIGNRIGIDFSLPEPIVKLSGQIFRNSGVTLGHAIAGLPTASMQRGGIVTYSAEAKDKFEKLLRNDAKSITDHFSVPLKGIQLERVQTLQPGQTMKDLPDHLQHESFKKRAYRRVMDGTPTEKRGGAPSGLKRLISNEPSLTITGAATRELLHPSEHRLLTIREAARIQTFPDSFDLQGNPSERIQQIGNAIPPLFARIIGEHIAKKYGFSGMPDGLGCLLHYSLTKASAMSPALKKTDGLLSTLEEGRCVNQLHLFGN